MEAVNERLVHLGMRPFLLYAVCKHQKLGINGVNTQIKVARSRKAKLLFHKEIVIFKLIYQAEIQRGIAIDCRLENEFQNRGVRLFIGIYLVNRKH